jgi:hypothetical protein
LTSTKKLDESLVYPDGLKERMHPQLVDELINQKTSLGKHPIFPDSDENSFEQKLWVNVLMKLQNVTWAHMMFVLLTLIKLYQN